MSSFRKRDPVDDAISLLGISYNPPPTKTSIERAFRVAAKRYHPDARKNEHADPSAERFRQCLEARDLLLDHFVRDQRHVRRSLNHTSRYSHHHNYTYWPPPPTKTSQEAFFAKGFPLNSLQLLTTRSKVYIKGATAALLLAMGLYDGYCRRQFKPTSRPSYHTNDTETS